MKVHRALVDAVNCPQSLIDANFRDSGVEYSLYHGDMFQLFIVGTCSFESALEATDAFFHEHTDRLIKLSCDETQPEGVYPQLVLEFTLQQPRKRRRLSGSEIFTELQTFPPRDDDASTGLHLPHRLLENLYRAKIPIKFF